LQLECVVGDPMTDEEMQQSWKQIGGRLVSWRSVAATPRPRLTGSVELFLDDLVA
jgi:hypothetical protein